ncbi:VOC family protein [Rossellomorea vietnamensis]|uniref:VOC family protein n=1 Tax=Rossellomorea vietnamensis TaxID=218284 RepID=A0A5D4MAG2_9BACI|nr:VOC family protein [Rossellomorea vietnamensis]TYR98682.1 VOC family protein [Rossellomorea vietnamensis]
MKWHHAGIEVERLERSTAFYEKIFGFKEESCLKMGEEKIVFLTCGPIVIELIENREQTTGSSNLHFAWEVGDLAYWMSRLENWGLKPEEGPYRLDSGWDVIFYKGPDGEVIELVSKRTGVY